VETILSGSFPQGTDKTKRIVNHMPMEGIQVPEISMPYTHQGWTLYTREVKLKRGPKVNIYFFSKRKPKSGRMMDDMPKGYKVGVNKRTGLPYLKKA